MGYAGYKHTRFWDYFDHGLLRELGLPALVVSLVLFVSAMTLLGANLSELRGIYARVQQTNEALVEIASINADILRIEMTVRGYALSGDPNYPQWQKEASAALQRRLETMTRLTADDDDERTDTAILKKLLAAHEAHFDRMARLVPTDRARVVAEMIDYSKKVKRRPIEDMLADMRADETRRLAVQEVEAENRIVHAYRYAIGISTLALLFGAVGFAMLLNDRRRTRRLS